VRSFAAVAAAAVGAMLLQTTVFTAFPWLPVMPDPMLVLAVYLGVRHPGAGGACGAFLLGYFLDTFSGTILGVNAFAFTAVYLAAHLIARRLWVEGGLPLMVTVFLAGLLRSLVAAAIATLVATHGLLWQHVVGSAVASAAVAAAIAPAVFACVSWEKRLIGLA
jgi:rod shape-determining protein MreD